MFQTGQSKSRSVFAVLAAVMFTVGAWCVRTAPAQQPPDKQRAAQPPPIDVHIDVPTLIDSPKVLESSVNDPVWKIEPGGRQLIKIPVIVQPSDEPLVLKPGTLRFRGGRFLAWQIVEYEATDAIAPEKPGSLVAALVPVPQDAPRLARKVTIKPGGVVSWSLDRTILGATVSKNSDNLFALRIDAAQLKSLQPNKRRVNRRKNRPPSRQDSAEFRQKMVEFRELRDQVRSVQREFAQRMPRRLWAIFDANKTVGDMTITGIEPGAWTLSISDLKFLREIASHRGKASRAQGGGLDAQTHLSVDRMSALVGRNRHPYTLQAVAFTLGKAQWPGLAQRADPLYQLMAVLLQGDDVTGRRMVVKSLASLSPPTPAARMLLKKAAFDSDPTIQLWSLQSVLSTDDNNPAALSSAVAESVQFLVSQQRVEPDRVLAALLATARADPDNAGPLISRARLPFDQMRGSRLDNAVVFVIRRSATDPVAADWLNLRLLGAPQPRLVMRTLEILDSASLGRPVIEPAVDQMLDLWLGSPTKQPSAQAVPKIALAGPIPITTSGHSLFRTLQSGHARMRSLAWRQLRLFEIPFDPVKKHQHDEQRGDPYAVFTDVALAQDQTPSEAADFLDRQKDRDRGTLGLVKLVMSATPRTAGDASRYLARSDRPIDWALGQLNPTERQRFAIGLYEAHHMEVPLAVVLLRQASEKDKILDWFGSQVAHNSTPPDRVQWGRSVVSEHEMLDIVADTEDLELAKAAVDVLVASAGGDVRQAESITTAMFGKQRHLLTTNWTEHRRKLYVDNIAKAAGSYQLVLYVYKKPDGPRSPRAATRPFDRQDQPIYANPQQELRLGIVDLRVDGEKISFDTSAVELSVPDDQLAIRFVNPSELQNLANRQVNKLPLDGLRYLDLLPEDNNVWRGTATLPNPDLRPIMLLMSPSDR